MSVLQLLLLSSAWCLAPATLIVETTCSGNVSLPCTAPWHPQTPYTTIVWEKINARGGELTKILGVNQSLSEHFHYEKEINGSLEACPPEKCSLKIRNITCQNAGIYRCTLQAPGEENSPSDIVFLKVAGCTMEHEDDKFKKYRAEVLLLLVLAMFYVFLIVFTCKFAKLQSIFPDINKQGMERTFLHVPFPNKKSTHQMVPATVQKTDLV
ncbi:CD83 antigen [Gracilinanus agilis]|uniref:CD83 antigen n=1 Tax=Gracilinanus agilis TaxID=191870 RepID=UPI001CFD09E6|nr:CD83 antigen [Gracilinanus agilis]